jgi:DtxR family Mn-dependent transcriptional regulator
MWKSFFKKSKSGSLFKAVNYLSDLIPGQFAFISGIAEECDGIERRRLMDLGFVPGSRVEAAISSPFKDPVAYRIKGSLIALRKQQADKIRVSQG